MTREQIEEKIVIILKEEFEIECPDHDLNLTEEFEFDSIDAIALLEHVEDFIGSPLTQEDKKRAMEIRTINQICDFIENTLNKNKSEG
ncbi:MAG: acyl carrier protein [Chrysiogenales bacterium]|nr:MAG: acyl carrier protein [Chrysiogenales bacterium]